MQLICLSRSLQEKRPQYQERQDKIILQHASARPHVAKVVEKYLETLKWGILPYRTYSPDVARLDHLFRSISHCLTDQIFRSYEKVEEWIHLWIASIDNTVFRG